MKKVFKMAMGCVCALSVMMAVGCDKGGSSEPQGNEVERSVWSAEFNDFVMDSNMKLTATQTLEYPNASQTVSGTVLVADGKIYQEFSASGITEKMYFAEVDGQYYDWQWASYEPEWEKYSSYWGQDVAYDTGAGVLVYMDMLSLEDFRAFDSSINAYKYFDCYDLAEFDAVNGVYVYENTDFTMKVKFVEDKLYSITVERERTGYTGTFLEKMTLKIEEGSATIGALPVVGE